MCKDLDGNACTELLETIPDFTTLFERKTPEDVQRMLDEYLAGDAEELSSETTQYGGSDTTTTTTTTTTSSGGTSVDDAFKELLGS